MSRLDILISEFCTNGVEFVSLGEILKSRNASRCVSKKDYKEVGSIPIIDQSQAYISAYTDDESAVPPVLPCIIFGDHTRVIKYADQKFAQGDSGTKVLIPVDETINAKYVYYAFCNLDIPSRGYNRHWTIARDLKIPLPPLPVQQEIVRILDRFSELSKELTEELSAELKARKRQYEYYRDLLFTFGDDVPVVKLGDIGTFIRGSGLQKKDFTDEGIGCIHYGQIYTHYGTFANETISFVSPYLASGLKKVNTGDIIIAITSENVEDVCKCVAWLGKNEIVTGGHTAIFKHNQNPKYISYYFQTSSFFIQKCKIAQGTKVIEVSPNKLEKILIPLPSMKEQERIVTIMEYFETLHSGLASRLTAEIEARRKQYEYYRNKLLSFKGVSA